MNYKKYTLLTLLSVAALSITIMVGTAKNTQPLSIARGMSPYYCSVERNISNKEISNAIDSLVSGTTMNFTTKITTGSYKGLSAVEAFSSYIKENNTFTLLDSVTGTNAAFQKDYGALKAGTGSAGGNITFTLKEKVSAIGFYMSAWNNSKEKTSIQVNEYPVELKIGNYIEDYSNNEIRYVVNLDTPTNIITVSSSAKNNRFCIYSIGFYTE